MNYETDAPGAAELSRARNVAIAFSQDYWTIGEMSRRYDVSLRTLRFYEDRGLISPLRHGSTRFYDERCRQRLERVLKAKKLGFTLSRIYRLFQKNGAADLDIAETLPPAEIAAQITALEKQKADLDKAIGHLRAVHERNAVAQSLARAG